MRHRFFSRCHGWPGWYWRELPHRKAYVHGVATMATMRAAMRLVMTLERSETWSKSKMPGVLEVEEVSTPPPPPPRPRRRASTLPVAELVVSALKHDVAISTISTV